MRGVIQVGCQRPSRLPAQALITPPKSRSKATATALAHQPPEPLRHMELIEEQHAALARRQPFGRTGMAVREQPRGVGAEQRGGGEIGGHADELAGLRHGPEVG